MPAVDQDRELDAARAPKVVQRVHRGARRSAAEKHIVHEYDGLAVEINRDVGGMNVRCHMVIEIVAMHAHVEHAKRDRMRQDRREGGLKPTRQKHAAALNANEHQTGILLVLFSNFVGDTGHHPLKSGWAEQDYFMGHNMLSFATSRDSTSKDRKRQAT